MCTSIAAAMYMEYYNTSVSFASVSVSFTVILLLSVLFEIGLMVVWIAFSLKVQACDLTSNSQQ